jgi:predicted lipid-binding transport protein (Tim44 family)
MKALLALLTAGLMFAGLFPDEAEAARRLGGARSLGTQRSVTPPPQKATPPQQSAQPAAPAQQAQQPARNRWLGPLAGLAAGLGLGWLLSQGGFGGFLAAALMALLVGVVVFAVLRLVMRKRTAEQPLRYAGMDREPMISTPHAPLPPVGSAVPGAAPPAAAPVVNVPAGFDTAAFLRQAKLNFIRLQEANDRRDLDSLREVMTPQMFDAILADLGPQDGSGRTDVMNLDGQLLEVVTEADKHWASVHFSGMIREGQGEATPFAEVWHLQKPVSGDSGWLLAGIQQAG